MNMPTLSVVMPNFNDAKFLPHAIESVMEQSLLPQEFYIYDDASTDDSVEVIKRYTQRYPMIRLVCGERNLGVVSALNIVYRLPKTDYILGLASDNWLCPGFFENAMQVAAMYPQAGIILGMNQAVDELGNDCCIGGVAAWNDTLYAEPNRVMNEYFKKELPVHSLSTSTIFKRVCLEEIDFFREDITSWCDTFAIRAIALKYGVCYLPVVCSKYRIDSKSFSGLTRENFNRLRKLTRHASDLMRSPEFRDRFPANYVRKWSRAVLRQAMKVHAWNRVDLQWEPILEKHRYHSERMNRLRRWGYAALIRMLYAFEYFKLYLKFRTDDSTE